MLKYFMPPSSVRRIVIIKMIISSTSIIIRNIQKYFTRNIGRNKKQGNPKDFQKKVWDMCKQNLAIVLVTSVQFSAWEI